jgi:hypothetical protein
MHPLDNTTRFFAVVGAPYIPERHLSDCCEQAPKQSFSASDLERECPQAAQARAWWPLTCH